MAGAMVLDLFETRRRLNSPGTASKPLAAKKGLASLDWVEPRRVSCCTSSDEVLVLLQLSSTFVDLSGHRLCLLEVTGIDLEAEQPMVLMKLWKLYVFTKVLGMIWDLFITVMG